MSLPFSYPAHGQPPHQTDQRLSRLRLIRLACLALVVTLLVMGCAAATIQAAEGSVENDGPVEQPLTSDYESDPSHPYVGRNPAAYLQMQVLDIIPADSGNVVLLSDEFYSVFVPIIVGNSEAMAIALRLAGEAYLRPLTHDLADAILRELGGELVEIHIDSLQDGVFVATITIRQGERFFVLDSRASDSIALAVGHGVPILVGLRVIEAAGVSAEEILGGELPTEPPAISGPGSKPEAI